MVELEAEEEALIGMDDSETISTNRKRKTGQVETAGKKRYKTKSLYRQPTANELNRLQETENLFNSNLFRLQIKEVLDEVSVSEKITNKFRLWFTSLKAYLLSIPVDDTQYDLSEKAFVKKYKAKLPLHNELKKTKCVFCFQKFDDVEVVGSYALGCAISSKLQVDLQITVPANTYTKNDSINYRYHKKRAAYLAYIACHLRKSDLVENIRYCLSKGCETKPVLLITPKGKVNKYLSVCLNLVCESSAYKLHRFSPLRNNLRSNWLFSTNIDDIQSEGDVPTPHYNNSILSDVTSKENQQFLEEILGKSENLKQAIVLLKIWIHQRKLQVSGHIISLFVAYLVQNKRINNIMSSYQIVRNVWISLKSSDWDIKGISLYKGSEPTPAVEEFHQQGAVVFLDKTGYYNVCWQMCRGTYLALKQESSLAIDLLDNGKINSFIPLFMTSYDALLQYDHIIRFRDMSELLTAVVGKTPKETRLNYGVDHIPLVVSELHQLLTKGLGSRADLVADILDVDIAWDIKNTLEEAKLDGHTQSLSFGLLLNPENATNLVDKGPQANLPEAEKFREFWGEKSELRRFQDGDIAEAVVWSGAGPVQRRAVPRRVAEHLLRRRYLLPPAAAHHAAPQLDALLQLPLRAGARPLAVREAAQAARRALELLRRDLRRLRLPLPVTAARAAAPALACCDPQPPAAAPPPPPRYVPALRVVLELGRSGRWPADPEAFRCVKAAFLARIAEGLRRQCGLTARAHPARVDVLRCGLAFRLQLALPKELTLLRRARSAGVLRLRDTERSERLHRETVLEPRLLAALHGWCSRWPVLGDVAVLLQRWAAAQLLSGHVPALTLQLLCAAALGPGRGAGPGVGPLRGLARVLRLVADTDWAATVLVVDFTEELTREEAAALERGVAAAGGERPALALLAWLGDAGGAGGAAGPWGAPAAAALRRLQALAGAALRHIDRQLRDMNDDLTGAFTASLAGYDVVVRLRGGTRRGGTGLGGAGRGGTRQWEEEPVDAAELPVLEFDPVTKYVEELRSAYDELALFFYDEFGGDVVCVLWRPGLRTRRPLQVASCHALKPVTEDGVTLYEVNLEAVIEDFRILGRGIVDHITVT